jgi:phosphoserine phosphatase RsbU/P
MSATDTLTQSPTVPDRIRFGLRFKIILGLTLFNILGTAIFATNHYRVEKEATIIGIEKKLAAAARALPDMLPPGYLDRAVTADGIPPEEYRKLVDQLSSYCADIGLKYLYSYYNKDGKFYTTSSNGTPEELADGSFAQYWGEYSHPLLPGVFASGQPHYDESIDEWGHVYFLFSPGVTPAGTRYIVGADIAISRLYAQLDASLNRSILIGLASFFVIFVFSFFIGTRISSKITQLAEYTQVLAAADFKPVQDLPLRQKIGAMPRQSRDEIAQLASSFISMETRLNTYLRELTETTATKERLRNELRIAGDIQLSMLPGAFNQVLRDDGRLEIDLHAAVTPTREAGGDLYDFFYLDDEHLCFVIGDVSDKGMPAALFMTVVISVLRARATADLIHAPEEILRQTNELLIPQNAMCQFVTIFLGILNVRTGVLVYSDGGHNHPYLRRAGGTPQMMEFSGGVALGIMPGSDYPRHTERLAPGDILFLYTDGVTEAIAADQSFYGEDRLQRELSDIDPAASAKHWVDTSMKSVHSFAEGHSQADDITVLTLRVLPLKGSRTSESSEQLLQAAASGDATKLEALRARVRAGEPAAYVAGFLDFAGRRFSIDRRAYITDPEALNLIGVVRAQGQALAKSLQRPLRVLEFGIGAGTLAITVKLEQPEWELMGLDIDVQALQLAADNAAAHGVDIALVQSDFLSAWPADRTEPDLIFGDPPWGTASDLYDQERDEGYYRQMPAASAFPPGGLRTGIHDQLIRTLVARGWSSLIVLNYGMLPEEAIAQSAAPLSEWQLVHPKAGLSVLVGRV